MPPSTRLGRRLSLITSQMAAGRESPMRNMIGLLTLLGAMIVAAHSDRALAQVGTAATSNPIVAWNRTLLTIVRTKGAQPATVHPTRSFAIMHAAIYDAVD